MRQDQPNYIFFISDQHRADHLGCYGNSQVKTPNIDRLAQSGTRFENFYVANPFCMPNRASLMTGRMPSLHRARTNGNPLPLESRTFVKSLREAGYRTALIGKSHLQNMTGQPRAHTPQEALGKDGRIFEAFEHDLYSADYDNENSRLWRENASHTVRTPFYGFDHVDLCTEHGDRVGGSYARWLAGKHPDPDTLRGPANALPDETIVTPQAWRTRVPEELYPSRYIADQTCEHLERLASEGEGGPFFIQCSFPDPHHPFTPPGRYWSMYDPASIPLPESFGQGDSPMLRYMRESLARGEANRTGGGLSLNSSIVHNFYATASFGLGSIFFLPGKENVSIGAPPQESMVELTFANEYHSTVGLPHSSGPKWSVQEGGAMISAQCSGSLGCIARYAGDFSAEIYNVTAVHSVGPWTFVEPANGLQAWAAVRYAWGGLNSSASSLGRGVSGSNNSSFLIVPEDAWSPLILFAGNSSTFGSLDGFIQ